MKHCLFYLCLLLSASTTFAQVPRLSLHEEFTGETCPPCASSDLSFDAVMAAPTSTTKIISIKWMVPIPSAPSPTWSLYKTNKTEIDWRYKPSPAGYGYTTQMTSTTTPPSNGILLAPMGQLDGQDQWVFGANSNHVLYMNGSVIDNAQALSSPFSVTMVKAWNPGMTVMTVTVNIVAAQNFTSQAALIFRAVMIEKTVTFSVAPAVGGETVFNNPVIASFPTLQSGTSLSQAWTTGQSQTFILTCPVPAYRRDINQVDMVGFIQDDGNQKIAQAVRASDCTARSITVSGPQEICPGQTVTLTAGGGSAYTWSTGQTGNSIVVTPSNTANYWVMDADAGFCQNTAAMAVRVTTCSGVGLKENTNREIAVSIYPNPNKGEFVMKTDLDKGSAMLIIYDVLGKKVTEQIIYSGESLVKTNLSKGIYNYQLVQSSTILHSGKLIID